MDRVVSTFGDTDRDTDRRTENGRRGNSRLLGSFSRARGTHVTWELPPAIQPCPVTGPRGAKRMSAASVREGMRGDRVCRLTFLVSLTRLHGNASGCVWEGIQS